MKPIGSPPELVTYIMSLYCFSVQETQLGNSSSNIAESLDKATRLTMRHLVDRSGLTMTALHTLGRLDQPDPVRLTSLAAAAGLSQPAMTQLIQRLERQGLTVRINDPEDGRAALIYLADAGRALLDRQRQDRRDRLNRLLATLSAEEHAALSLAANVALPILERLIETAISVAPHSAAASGKARSEVCT